MASDRLSQLLQTVYPSSKERKSALLLYAQQVLGILPQDVFEIRHQEEWLGVGLVLPYSTEAHAEVAHALLPDWRTVLRFSLVREDVGLEVLEHHWLLHLEHLRTQRPEDFQDLLNIHASTLKKMALKQEKLYRLVIHQLVFQSTQGFLTLQEMFKHTGHLRYVVQEGQFRQIWRVAQAQQHFVLLVQGDDEKLLRKYPVYYPDSEIESIAVDEYASSFPLAQQAGLGLFLNRAKAVLDRHRIRVEVREFLPLELPALFLANPVQQKFAPSSTDDVVTFFDDQPVLLPPLVLNHQNVAVQQLMQTEHEEVFAVLLEVLYLQARILGGHSMSSEQLHLLSDHLQQLALWGDQASRFRSMN